MKRTITVEKSGWNNKKKCIKRDKFGEREYWHFLNEQLGKNRGERGGNEVKEIYKKIKLEE